MPLLNQLTDGWRDRELTDVSTLVVKLLLWHDVFRKPVVSLNDLLGGIGVGEHDMSLCVPTDHFSVHDVRTQAEMTVPAQPQHMVSNMDVEWAFRGPGSIGPDSWLLLRCPDLPRSQSCPVILLCIQSKKRQTESCMQSWKLVEEAGKMLHIPGVDNLTACVTDLHPPGHAAAAACFVVPDGMVMMMMKHESLPAYYSACVAMVKRPIVSPHRTKRVRDGLSLEYTGFAYEVGLWT